MGKETGAFRAYKRLDYPNRHQIGPASHHAPPRSLSAGSTDAFRNQRDRPVSGVPLARVRFLRWRSLVRPLPGRSGGPADHRAGMTRRRKRDLDRR